MQKGRQQQREALTAVALLAKLQLEISRRRFVAHKAVNNTSECITNTAQAESGRK